MIEYTAYVIENSVPQNQLRRIFKDKNIDIDTHYIDEILKLQKLYAKVQDVYKNPNKVKQFMQMLKHSVQQKNEKVSVPNEVLRHFYSTFFDLINEVMRTSKQKRHSIIRRNVPHIHPFVIKYDYYFGGTIAQSFKLPFNNINYLNVLSSGKREFIVATSGGHIGIVDVRTSVVKTFTVYIPRAVSFDEGVKFSLCFGSKIVLGLKAAGIACIDFDTNEVKEIELSDHNAEESSDASFIKDFKILSEDRLIFCIDADRSSEYIGIFNIKTWQMEKRFYRLVHKLLLINETQFVSGYGSGLNFWHVDQEEPIHEILLTENVNSIHLFQGTQSLLVVTDKDIMIYDIETKELIKTVPSSIGSIANLLLLNKDIIVRTQNNIYRFGYDFLLIEHIGFHKDIQSMHIMPHDRIATVSNKCVKIWGTELELESTSINGDISILSDGRLVGIRGDALQIFE